MIIYRATNKINNKSYIGQTVKPLWKRKSEHIHQIKKKSNNYFHNALRKYGKDNFIWEILDDSTCKTLKQLNNMEIFYIAYYNTQRNGYNLTCGGKNRIISEETREKLRKAWENRTPMSNETKLKISNSLKGREKTEKTKKKLSESRKGMKFSNKHRENLSKNNVGNKGRKFSKETRLKMSLAAKNRKTKNENVR